MTTARLDDRRTPARSRADSTRSAILDAAVELVRARSVEGLSARRLAEACCLAERTVFRYFASRDALLDAVAAEVARRIGVPPPPRSIDALRAAPRALYERFEAQADLTRAALHADLYDRLRESLGGARWIAIRRVLDGWAPQRSAAERRIAAANIRYFLMASTWHYYRAYFRFSLDESIACAEVAVGQALDALSARPAGRSPPGSAPCLNIADTGSRARGRTRPRRPSPP